MTASFWKMDHFSGLDINHLQITCSSRKRKAKKLQYTGGNTDLPPSRHEQYKRNHILSMWCTLGRAHPPVIRNKIKEGTIATSHSCGIPTFLTGSPRVRFLSEVQSVLNSTLLILSTTYAGVKRDLYDSLPCDKGEGLAKWPAMPNERLGTIFCFQNNCLKCPF